MFKARIPQALAVVCLLALAAACSSSSKSKSATASPSSTTTPKGEPIKVGQIIPINSPALTLKEQAVALKASIDAYNGRGGLNGRPLQLDQCDDKNDPNLDVECARKMVSDGVVATLNDSSLGDAASVSKILTDAGIARVYMNPGFPEENGSCSKVCFNNSGGGTGVTLGMAAVSVRQGGIKNVSLIYPDIPSAAPLAAVVKGVVAANGGTLVNAIPLSGNATDYTQFVLAASKNGSEGAVLALGEAQATQVLSAAEQLNSKLKFFGSPATFTVDNLKQFPKVAQNIILTDSTPAPTAANAQSFPGMTQFLADMKATSDPLLAPAKLRTSQVRSWLAVQAFDKVMKGTDTKNVTKDSVLAAFTAAKDVDLNGVVKPWTPLFTNTNPILKQAWPWYYITRYSNNTLVTDPTPYNLIDAISGK